MEQNLTREEIKENRLKFAKGLQESHREKITKILESFNNSNQRCCLGHGCEIFNIERNIEDDLVSYGKENCRGTAPIELMDLLGLYDIWGGCAPIGELVPGIRALTVLNDNTELTTQEIGKLIEGWIEGGPSTPFKPLSSYDESNT